MPKRYSYPEIIAVTNHFTHKLGQGGFGSVYKGQLHTGGLIAVKMLENSKFSGEEFINEVSTIGRIHHVNVVQLLGFCSEGSKRALVYDATRGTIGYIAPELISRNFGTVSCKSDVYGFGMVLLEMAGGRRNSNMNTIRSSKAYFPSWVYDQLNKGGDLELRNVTEIESVIARKLCMIGLWCIQVKAADRPSMTKVLEMLEGSMDDLQMPPKPCFSSSRHISGREIESDSSTEFLVSEWIEECSFNDSYA
ncbi:hypothetical protein CUMW_267840 [Citrus unshiu]|uniref:Protein kinase domain-containing protein n=1 Tax=Citrus unshiu TaxID=55188 RepID=A0A2H5QWD3_CITUN|nr:hypothetical protein CUMW_267840 [Citrus unshiu]